MDGIHDLGGMDGFGPVDIENDETFHDTWEKKIFASTWTLLLDGRFNLDEFRFGIERMEPEYYLEASYWEHWLASVERLIIENDITTVEELHEAVANSEERPIDPESRAKETPSLAEVYETEPEDEIDEADLSYSIGDEVVVQNLHTSTHTRCPGYVKNKTGVIDDIRGEYHVPDVYVEEQRTEIEPVYSVRFSSKDLWGADREESEYAYVDLWERYLE
jgi:nitrile hydratase